MRPSMFRGAGPLRLYCCVAFLLAATLCSAAAMASTETVRGTFEASFYFGLGIDGFAASDLNRYLNPGESSALRERGVGGFDFGYRLLGKSEGRQLWIYGETVHGVRSADLDATTLDSLALFKLTGYADPGSRTLYLIRNATSLEAFAGIRYEFHNLHKDEPVGANLYAFADYGFLTVGHTGGDVLDVSNYGLGIVCVGGHLINSHFAASIGRSDFFVDHRKTRFKVDGMLNWSAPWMTSLGMSLFAQMTVDSDIGPGSDSVQSYLGFDYQLTHFLTTGPEGAAPKNRKD